MITIHSEPSPYLNTIRQIKQKAMKNLAMFNDVKKITECNDNKTQISFKGKEEFKKLFSNGDVIRC